MSRLQDRYEIFSRDAASNCTIHEGFVVDPTKTAEPITAKPIGEGKGRTPGNGESTARIVKGKGKILAPSTVLLTGNSTIPQLRVLEIPSEGKPIVFFKAPDMLAINSSRPSSRIILNANTRDSIEMRSSFTILHKSCN